MTVYRTGTPVPVGIIANPASGRDIRRIVAHGEAVTTHHKLNQLQRLMAGLGSVGVQQVLSMTDGSGIMAGLLHLADRSSASGWPALEFVDQPITRTAADSVRATAAMVERGVGVIVVVGGDGTNRVVSLASADVPLASISTGTNNAFPGPDEPTIVGIAAGLVAQDVSCKTAATYRAKRLEVESADVVEHALVDVAISSADGVGSGAVWDAETISELFLCFAEPTAIGLSAIGGHLHPTTRLAEHGLAIALGSPAAKVVRPPIGPGLPEPVAVKSVAPLPVGTTVEVQARCGVVAVDGERLFRFGRDDRLTVTLRSDGPRVVDVPAALRHAAADGLLARTSVVTEDRSQA